MENIENLFKAIAAARAEYIETAKLFSETHAQSKPSPIVWNAVEITEHLYWAEQGGIFSIWKTLAANNEGKTIWEGEKIHDGKAMDTIIAQTWKEKEEVPAVAAPRLGGPLAYWVAMLYSLGSTLEQLKPKSTVADLTLMTPPHPISGPFNLGQRLEFLAFHIKRHQKQLENLL